MKKDKKIQLGVRIPKTLINSIDYLLDKSGGGLNKNLVVETALHNFFQLPEKDQINHIKTYLWERVIDKKIN